jgi:hypothetical protein
MPLRLKNMQVKLQILFYHMMQVLLQHQQDFVQRFLLQYAAQGISVQMELVYRNPGITGDHNNITIMLS